jgi:2-succinyl-5-enolpyruvyl-6-hydroxy-3-cyclohexene-1-carboxylate synthase
MPTETFMVYAGVDANVEAPSRTTPVMVQASEIDKRELEVDVDERSADVATA